MSPSSSNRARRSARTLGLTPARPPRGSLKRFAPSSSPRTTSRVQRSPRNSSARARAQNWSYFVAGTGPSISELSLKVKSFSSPSVLLHRRQEGPPRRETGLRPCRSRPGLRRLCAVEPHGLRDSLHHHRAQLFERHLRQTVVNLGERRVREQHLARPGDVDDAGGDVHVVTDQVAAPARLPPGVH